MTTTEPDAFALAFAAGRRYWFDPTFAEQVKRAVKVAEAGQPDDGFDRFDRHSLTMGAAVALHLASLDEPAEDGAKTPGEPQEHQHTDPDEYATPGHLHHWHGVPLADVADLGDADLAARHRCLHCPTRPLGDHGSQRDGT